MVIKNDGFIIHHLPIGRKMILSDILKSEFVNEEFFICKFSVDGLDNKPAIKVVVKNTCDLYVPSYVSSYLKMTGGIENYVLWSEKYHQIVLINQSNTEVFRSKENCIEYYEKLIHEQLIKMGNTIKSLSNDLHNSAIERIIKN